MSVSSRGNSAPMKVKKNNTVRGGGIVNKSMNSENEPIFDKYHILNKAQASRTTQPQRSFVKDVPIKENNRKYNNLDKTQEILTKTQHEFAQTYASPIKYNNTSRIKSNRFNVNLQ